MGSVPTFTRRSGLSEVLVIILVLLALLLAVPALVLYNQIAAKSELHYRLGKQIDDLNTHVLTERIGQIREAIGPAGFEPKLESSDMKEVANAAATAAESFRQGQGEADVWKKFTEEFDLDDPDRPDFAQRPKNLQDMVLAMVPPADAAQIAERVNRTKEDVARKTVETANVLGPGIRKPHDDVLKAVQEDSRKVDEDQGKENTGFSTEKDLIETIIKQMQQDKADKELELKRFEKAMNQEIGRLQLSLDEFKRKELINFARISEVGEVFRTSSDGKTAYLKLGSREGVVVGMKFHVGNKGLHGKVVPKGVIEVRQIFPEMSEATVTRLENERNPIVAGDLLVNPFYHPRRPVVVRIVGRQQAAGTLSRSDASGRIEAIGGVVRPRLAPDLDFVIVTDENMNEAPPEDQEDLDTAERLNLPVYAAKDLFIYLED